MRIVLFNEHMKRLFTLVVLLLIVGNALLARRVPLEQAQGYARNWWLQKDGPRSVVLQHVATEFDNIYLFVDTAGRGFVMLAADDRSLPVLGYSLRNDFIVTDMPPHVYGWLQDYNNQIQWLIDNNIEKTKEINEQWKDLGNERRQLPQTWSTSVQPLVQTTWDQGTVYNDSCPLISGNKTYTGCVATAMAQIMKYWNHPQMGMGSYSYSQSDISGTISANFATTYDWDNMRSKYTYYGSYSTAELNAIAKIMYHAGVAVKMDYGTSGSGAYVTADNYDEPAAVNAYKKYFKYKWTATSVYIGDYSDDGWKLLLKAEIDAGRPIQYSGSGSGGHSFVCDGYNNNEKFHFNWGWNGSNDGYFAIGSLNPGSSHNYSLSNKAAIGIEPDLSTTTQLTITAVANNYSWGTVSLNKPSGVYTKYLDTVSIMPLAQSGCRFVKWSIESSEVPLKFMANGDNANLVANFEQLHGDTLHYCRESRTSSYRLGTDGTTQYWGIILPSSVLSADKVLNAVMLYVNHSGSYTVRIYEGGFSSTAVYSETFNITQSSQWVTLPLTTVHRIDQTKDLCIGFESNTSFPCTVSTSASSESGAYGHSSTESSWDSYVNKYGVFLTWMIKAVTAPIHKISIDATKAKLTSVSKSVDLRTIADFGVSNKGATVDYAIVSSSPANIATIAADVHTITATGVGTITLKATATDSRFGSAEATVDVTIGKGTLVFDNHNNDGSWANAANWAPHYSKLPDPVNFNARVDVACNVASTAACGDLSFGTSGSVTVASNGVLNVQGELSNNDASKLIIKADTAGSGSVIFNSGSPKATVEMYLKGTANANGKNPDWQLRGSIVGADFALKNPDEWANIHVYRWDETNNANGCWTDKMVGSAINLEPWKGYGFANYSTSPATVKYTGTLLDTANHWLLTKNGNNANTGNNMLTNSYSAPITISNLYFNGPKASVIFYNTGSLNDWQKYEGDTEKSGNQKGQMLVCPLWTAGAADLPTTIPAGQSFYVVANHMNDAVEVEYSDIANAHSEPMLAPGRQDEFNVLAVNVSGTSGDDRVVLIESDNCTDNYDDGYDGMKYPGNAALPQLFVSNSFGNTSINASKTILGQKIGVSAPEVGTSLKMTFETAKLQGFARLLVQDIVTGRYVDILAGEEYEFTTTANDTKRFEVVGFRMQNGEENDEQLRVYGNRLFVGANSGRMTMYDMSGKLVWQADVQPDEWLELPELLHGVYVIKTDGSITKIIK